MYSLSLFGIDLGSHIRTDRVRSNGTDVVYSKVVTQPAGTRCKAVHQHAGPDRQQRVRFRPVRQGRCRA